MLPWMQSMQAIEEAEQFPQYYIDKAVLYTHLKDYRKAKHWLNLATAFDMPTTTLMVAPRDMKVRALECDAHIAMYYDRDLKRVADDYQQLLEVDPGNETYQQNLRVATSLDAANKGMQSVVYLGKYLEQIGEAEKIVPLLQAVPIDFQKEPFYAQMRHKHIPPRLWDEDEIAILCGPGFEPWTPKSIEKGLGGSEEAVVYLGQELAKLGWKVTVYANPESEEG
jgi:tetratricopeptide (TPR) repeat protein